MVFGPTGETARRMLVAAVVHEVAGDGWVVLLFCLPLRGL